MKNAFLALVPAMIGLAACGSGGENAPETGDADTSVAAIPDTLAPFGDGYPSAGDPCMQLGESAATSDYLDDSTMLVGCPTAEQAAALGGDVVATIEGVTLVSVSTGDGNQGMPPVTQGSQDALVPGTD